MITDTKTKSPVGEVTLFTDLHLRELALRFLLVISTLSLMVPSVLSYYLIHATDTFILDVPTFYSSVASLLSAIKDGTFSFVVPMWNAVPAILAAILIANPNERTRKRIKISFGAILVMTFVFSLYPMFVLNGASQDQLLLWSSDIEFGQILIPELAKHTSHNYQLSLSYLALLTGLHFTK